MNVSKGTVEKNALLFVVCGIVFAANYAQYQVSGLAHLVVSDLHLTSAEFSAVLFAPFVPAVVFGMPVGVCADRYGVKVLVFIASAISAIAAVARAECASFATLFTATMLLGAAPCVVNAIVLKVLGSAFGGETDRAMGWFYAAGSGGIACSLATSPLFATPGQAYTLAAVLFAMFGLLWLLVAPSADVLQAADGFGVQGAEPAASSASAFAAVIKMPMVWLVAILLGVALASATAYSGYLVSALEVSTEPQVAGLLASFVTLGSIVGSVAVPTRERNLATIACLWPSPQWRGVPLCGPERLLSLSLLSGSCLRLALRLPSPVRSFSRYPTCCPRCARGLQEAPVAW